MSAPLPAISLADLRRLIAGPGSITIDILQLESAVVPVAQHTQPGAGAPELLGVIIDGDVMLQGHSPAEVLSQLRMLLGEIESVAWGRGYAAPPSSEHH